MWTAIITGLSGLVSSWFETKIQKQQQKAEFEQRALQGEIDYDLYAMKQKQHTLLDDFIGITFTSPFIVAWFAPERAEQWILFVSGIPSFYWLVFAGIVASTFGLRWWFKKQQSKITGRALK